MWSISTDCFKHYVCKKHSLSIHNLLCSHGILFLFWKEWLRVLWLLFLYYLLTYLRNSSHQRLTKCCSRWIMRWHPCWSSWSGITQEDNSCTETGADVNRDSLSGCLDDDSAAWIDRAGLSDSLFVKFCVACLIVHCRVVTFFVSIVNRKKCWKWTKIALPNRSLTKIQSPGENLNFFFKEKNLGQSQTLGCGFLCSYSVCFLTVRVWEDLKESVM